MEITHAPGPEGTRRFRLSVLETRKDELVVYSAAFEGDPALAGEPLGNLARLVEDSRS